MASEKRKSAWKSQPKVDPAGYTKTEGKLTWISEGTEGGPGHSRRVQPAASDSSGAAICRGYDLKGKDKRQIVRELTRAHIPAADAAEVAKLAGLRGTEATKKLKENKLLQKMTFEKEHQLALFETSYKEAKTTVSRVCNYSRSQKVAKLDCSKVDPAIMEVVVDMTFRGEFARDALKGQTESRQATLQRAMAKGDLHEFKTIISDREAFPVSVERLNSRIDYLDEAIAARKKSEGAPRTEAPRAQTDLHGILSSASRPAISTPVHPTTTAQPRTAAATKN